MAEPDGDGELPALEMLDDRALEPGFGHVAQHRIVGEAEPRMGVAGPELLALGVVAFGSVPATSR